MGRPIKSYCYVLVKPPTDLMQENIFVMEEDTGRVVSSQVMSIRYSNEFFKALGYSTSGLECSKVVRLHPE